MTDLLPLLLKAWQVGYNYLFQGGCAINTRITNEYTTAIAAAENHLVIVALCIFHDLLPFQVHQQHHGNLTTIVSN